MRRSGGGELATTACLVVLRRLLVLTVLTVVVTACTGGQGGTGPPRLTQAPSPSPTLTAVDEAGACLGARVLSIPHFSRVIYGGRLQFLPLIPQRSRPDEVRTRPAVPHGDGQLSP